MICLQKACHDFDILKEFLRRVRYFLNWFSVRYIEWAPNTTENMSATNTVFNGFEQFVFPLKHDQVECKAPTVPPNGQNEDPQRMPVCIEIPIVMEFEKYSVNFGGFSNL